MILSEIIKIIDDISKNIGTKTVITGGTPRDKVLNKSSNIEDIDLTTGDDKIHFVAKEASIKLQSPNMNYKVLDDGHAQITIGGFKLDFSSNFNIPNVRQMLEKSGLKNPDNMLAELYSRDFTCNALLMTLDLKKIEDPMGLGLQDIKAKKLRTCLPAAVTLGYDNKRVVRVLYMAAKLDFTVDEEIIDWVKKNPDTIKNCTQQYLIKKLAKSIKYNKEKTVQLLDQMGLWKSIPPVKELEKYMINSPERI